MIVAREMRGTHNPEGMTGFDGREACHPFGVEDKLCPIYNQFTPSGLRKTIANCSNLCETQNEKRMKHT